MRASSEGPDFLFSLWQRVFTNEGHGTLHDFHVRGLTLMGCPSPQRPNRGEIMMMDSGMATLAAIMDSFVHLRDRVLQLFPGIPARWQNCSFSGLYVEGGFRISATRSQGRVSELTITATRPARLIVQDPWNPTLRHNLAFNGADSQTLHPESEEFVCSGAAV